MRGEMKTFFFAPNHCKLEIIVCVTSAYTMTHVTSHWWLSEWMNWDKALCVVISFRPMRSNSKWIRIEEASSPVSNSSLLFRVIRRNWCFYTSILIYLPCFGRLVPWLAWISVFIHFSYSFFLVLRIICRQLFYFGAACWWWWLGNWTNCCANQFNMIMEKSSHFVEFLQLLHSFPASKKREKYHFQVDWIKNACFVICQTEYSVLQTHFYDSNCVHFLCTTFCSLHYIDGNYWEFFFISFILRVTSNPMES